jgi:hypothetical protein
MAIFSNKIVNVYYTDENLSNVTILYNYEKDGETLVGEYYLLVDETEAQFQDLMKEVTYQDIELATLEMHKAHRNQLKALVDEEVKKVSSQKIIADHLKSTDEHYKVIFEYDPDKDADELFKCKMYLFTLDIIKNGSKTFRTKVRKAENTLELCKLFDTEKRRVERKEAK